MYPQNRSSRGLVKAAMDITGGKDALAAKLGISVNTVRSWLYTERKPGFAATQTMVRMVDQENER